MKSKTPKKDFFVELIPKTPPITLSRVQMFYENLRDKLIVKKTFSNSPTSL